MIELTLPPATEGNDFVPWLNNDEDEIRVRVRPRESPNLPIRWSSFSIAKVPEITWWKALELHDAPPNLNLNLEIQDGTNRSSGDLALQPPYDIGSSRFVLAKAKFAGVHWPMYSIPGVQLFFLSVDFLWVRDT